MAIIKEMDSKFGVSLSYHRIIAFNINYVAKKAVICVASYHSKEARANHSAPLEEIDIEVPESDFYLFSEASPIIQGYQWLKDNVVGFDDSIDDFEVVEGTAHAPSETETAE
jgi:hypothetical protein